jgi:hypothetical protein
MHGAEALLVCGHPAADRNAFRDLLAQEGLAHLALVTVSDAMAEKTIGEISTLRRAAGEGEPSSLRRAIVMSGLAEKELHVVMRLYRESGMPQPFWAVVTPVSESWPLRKLLDELAAERESLKEAVEKDGLVN